MTDRARLPAASDVPDLESTSERTIVDLRGLGPFVSVGRYRYLAAHDPLPPQRHARLLVLALPLRGRFDVLIDGHVTTADPGEAIRIRPGSTYVTGIGVQPRGELLWLLLNADAPGGEPVDPVLARVIRQLVESDCAVWPVPPLSSDLLTRVLAAPPGDDALSRAWRQSLCTSALIDLLRGRSTDDADRLPMHPGLRRALEWMEGRLSEPISVTQLMDVSQMSATHFYETFTKTFGTSPKDHILRVKIERAEDLLTEGSHSITSIAYELGFSTSKHFSAAFRRYVGMSPTEFREGTGNALRLVRDARQ
ncbi:AraC family transcriptional regulator [Tenggerimyces flavus]|uniref:Helix-turn-helix domain-containing protein n=1 Tax=Tenggerimyces flavus TaxID=1708749 RepID=A0ABV7YFQ1_9ACTN|nr:AraC family transcriptional regulator [Tenggerimyces flavus]MBM7786978.1 AraC-like DNA-binding protein [Tenggerimyces flavus]